MVERKELCGVYHSPFEKYPRRYYIGQYALSESLAKFVLETIGEVKATENDVGFKRVEVGPK